MSIYLGSLLARLTGILALILPLRLLARLFEAAGGVPLAEVDPTALPGILPELFPSMLALAQAGAVGPAELALGAAALVSALILLIPPLARAVLIARDSLLAWLLRFAIVGAALFAAALQVYVLALHQLPPSVTPLHVQIGLYAFIVIVTVMLAFPGFYGRRLMEAGLPDEDEDPDRPFLRDEWAEAQRAGGDLFIDTPSKKNVRNYVAELSGAVSEERARAAVAEPTGRARVVNFVAALVVFGAIGLGFFGMLFARFLPTAEIAGMAGEFRFAFTGMVVVFAALLGLTGYRLGAVPIPSTPARVVLHVALFGAAAWFLAPHALTRGLPGAHAYVMEMQAAAPPESEVVVVSVAARGRAMVRRGCDFTATVTGEVLAGPGGVDVCGIDPYDWERLRPGDRLELVGHRTPYGFRYRSARLAGAGGETAENRLPQVEQPAE